MPLVPPNLDDRRFEDLMTEIRRRIPSFTPEWTDLNESDPGITLAQLFAFMTEHLLFQVNQVPEKGLITFLRMIGAELHPATPAVADVTLSGLLRSDSGSDLYVPIDAGTRVSTSAPPAGERSPVHFETAEAFTYLRGTIVDLISIDCEGNVVSNAAANRTAASAFRPLGSARSLQDSFYLVLDLDVPDAVWPAGTFRIRVNVAGSTDVGEPPPIVRAEPLPPRLTWAYVSGSTTTAAGTVLEFTELELAGDSTDELTRSGYLQFRFDADDVLKRAPLDVEPEAFRGKFVLRAKVARTDAYGTSPPALSSLRLNTVPARNLTTVVNEIVGSSTGLPFQRFRLANAPVFPGSVIVTVNGPNGPETWTEVADLFAAGPADRVFQLYPATGEILFGNGRFGAIPAPDTSGAGANLTARYRFGGGRRGNVGVGTLTQIAPPPGIAQLDATNLLPALGGDEEEPLAEGLVRAPAVVRSRYRAVSTSDFEALAREAPDTRIARALALANTRPGLAAGSMPGAVTVICVPHVRYEDSVRGPIPLPSHVAASVLRYLDERRLVTTQVFVRGAEFRRITIDATLVVERGASLAGTRTAALDAVQRYFHALVGGDGTGWPFGGRVSYSGVFERLLEVRGVARVDRLRMRLDDGEWVECADLPIAPGQLLFSGEHVIRIGGTA